MKKNIFKKVVASLATVAMAAGLFTAMPAKEAKAAEPTNKTVYLVVAEDDEQNWAMNYWSGLSTDAATADIGWGSGNKKPTFTKVQDGLLKMNVTCWSDMNQSGNGIQIVSYVTEGANTGEYKACADAGKDTYWNDVYAAFSGSETEIWLALDYAAWTVKTTTPVEIQKTDAEFAAEAEAVIDAALAVDATKDNKDKYDAAKAAYDALSDAQKALVDADKVAELTDGVEAIVAILEAEQAAKDAADAGKLTVYVKNADWSNMKVYGWGGADFGEWSGTALTALVENEGWYSITCDITKAVNLIFNDGTTQTVDWNNVVAGTYWLVLTEKNGEGKYLVDNVSTTAPEGWKEEAAEEIENPGATTPDTDKPADDSANKPATDEKKGITVEVTLGSEAKWDKVYLYAWGGDVKVEWPGVEMTQKDGKWYATLDTTATKLSYVISNGDKEQTVDIKDVEGTNVKITLGAKNADGKFELATAGGTGTEKPGDVAPVAMMLVVAAVAAAMVVASKKKKICE